MHKKEIRSLISSMLLGDGCLSCKYNAHRKGQDKQDLTGVGLVLHIAHSEVQRDYLDWKGEELDKVFKEKKIARKCSRGSYVDRRTGTRQHQIHLAWTKYFRIIYPKIYKLENNERVKKVQWILDQIDNDKHLFIWFADDGCEMKSWANKEKSLLKSNPSYRLHTNNFTVGECNIISQWFKSKYNVTPKIKMWKGGSGNLSPVLMFGVKESKKIWEHIEPYVLQFESMRNKFKASIIQYSQVEIRNTPSKIG